MTKTMEEKIKKEARQCLTDRYNIIREQGYDHDAAVLLVEKNWKVMYKITSSSAVDAIAIRNNAHMLGYDYVAWFKGTWMLGY